MKENEKIFPIIQNKISEIMMVYGTVKILLTNIIQSMIFIGSNSRLPTNNRDSTLKSVNRYEY